MDATQRFLAYAAAFEQTYADDDWSRLEPFFTEDAVYRVTGEPPLGGRWEGRGEVLRHLRESVDAFDRRFDVRRVEPLGPPRAEGNRLEVEWRGTYRRAGAPDLVIGGTERVVFEGDRIRLLEDLMEPGCDARIREHLERHPPGPTGG